MWSLAIKKNFKISTSVELALHSVFSSLPPDCHLWRGLSTDFCAAPTIANTFTECNRSCLLEMGQHQHQFPTACALSQHAYLSTVLLLLWDRDPLWCCHTPGKRVLGVLKNMFHRAGAVPILISACHSSSYN